MKTKIIHKRDVYTIIMIVCLLSMLWGQILNHKVIYNNNCLMPVFNSVKANISTEHFNYNEKAEIKYWYLSDILGWKNNRFSIGDIFCYIGLCIFIGVLILFGIDIIKSDGIIQTPKPLNRLGSSINHGKTKM